MAGEPVQRVHRRTLVGCEQPGGQEEGAAVLGVDGAAAPVGLAQAGSRTPAASSSEPIMRCTTWLIGPAVRARPVIRSAANRPDSSAVGTPTPGTVDDPASTTLSMPRTVLAGRNGPVWPKVCANANGVPATMP